MAFNSLEDSPESRWLNFQPFPQILRQKKLCGLKSTSGRKKKRKPELIFGNKVNSEMLGGRTLILLSCPQLLYERQNTGKSLPPRWGLLSLPGGSGWSSQTDGWASPNDARTLKGAWWFATFICANTCFSSHLALFFACVDCAKSRLATVDLDFVAKTNWTSADCVSWPEFLRVLIEYSIHASVVCAGAAFL